jgi:L-arabinose isomerase
LSPSQTTLLGLASQRLMAAGYGFGAEGDWKHATLGGCSFMEDYTYHLNPKGMKVLGVHHTAFSQPVTAEYIEDFSAMAGIEFLCIDKSTTIRDFKNELRWNAASYFLMGNV